MPLKLVRTKNHIELWHLTHDTASVEVFTVKDPRRTPEDWPFNSRAAADAKFDERLVHAETRPPLR
jgi:hypothetical protein